jgi:nitric oxide reductase activation protein
MLAARRVDLLATGLPTCTKKGEVAIINDIVAKHKPIVSRLKHLRKQEDGDEIDLNVAVRAMMEMRMGEQPDTRIMMRNVHKVRDPQYLRFDAKKAVEELTRNGIFTYCLSLNSRADQYVSRIFGAKNCMVVDHVQHLPEKLPLLHMSLTR